MYTMENVSYHFLVLFRCRWLSINRKGKENPKLITKCESNRQLSSGGYI